MNKMWCYFVHDYLTYFLALSPMLAIVLLQIADQFTKLGNFKGPIFNS